MPAAVNAFVAHCTELLGGLGPVRVRRMFGGHGLYAGEVFVALIAADRLYLKVDAISRPAFEAAGCVPFTFGGGKTVVLGYFSAPDDAMESAPAMHPWARLALAAAMRARAAKPAAARSASAAKARKGAVKSTAAKA